MALGNVKSTTTVSEVMTDFAQQPHTLVSVTPDTSVLAAMEIMTEQCVRHIPCISPAAPDGSHGATMEGMVSIGDVVKALLSQDQFSPLFTTFHCERNAALVGDYSRGGN